MALRQADQRLQQAQYEVLAARQDLMLRVAERYFNQLAAHDSLVFAKAETQSLKSQLEQAQQRFQVGLIAITDVQEAQAGYDRAQAAEIGAENDVENANEALREVTANYYFDLGAARRASTAGGARAARHRAPDRHRAGTQSQPGGRQCRR